MGGAVNVGMVGCGNMGSALAEGIAASAAGCPVGFYDALPEKGESLARKHGGRSFDSLDALLADDAIDAVAVATPPVLHEEQVVAAARAGKHVFVEKPMAFTAAACDRMVAAGRDAGVTLMVGQVLRYCEAFCSVLRWAREGRFGRPIHASVRRMGGSFSRSGWRARLETVGGYLYEVGVHELDFLRCLMGRPAQVYAVRQKVRPGEHEMEDAVSVLMRFESGASGHYEAGTGWVRTTYDFALCFEKATLLSGSARDPAALVAFTADPEPQQIPLEGFETESPVARQMRAWVESLLSGAPVPVPGEEGRESIRLAEAAYRSADTGKVQVLPAASSGGKRRSVV